jgi:glucose-1-phosphatase
MIDTIIFDFGDVFINLDKNAITTGFNNLGLTKWNKDLTDLTIKFETGKIDELQFISSIQKHIPNADLIDIRTAWNSILLDFPLERLEFLQLLRSKYNLFLLSNTNVTHIEKFEHKVGQSFARDFYSCFEKVYFSYDIKLRKPEEQAFKFILNNHNLIPKKTLFIDDTLENIEAAKKLELNTWHLNPKEEDITNLHNIIKNMYA